MPQARKSVTLHTLQETQPEWTSGAPSVFHAGRAKVPAHLTAPERVAFKKFSKLLGERRTETPGDVAALALLAVVYVRWQKAKAELDTRGLTVEDIVLSSNGVPIRRVKLNPLLRVVSDCESKILAVVRELALTPLSRDKARPAAPAPPPVGKRYAKPGSVAEQLLKQNPQKARELWPNLILWEGKPDERPQ